MSLRDILRNILARFKYTYTEQDTKQYAIYPILQALDWNVFLSEEVKVEYSTGRGRVDLALFAGGKPAVFIEAKRPSEDLFYHEDQLIRYSYEEGVRLAVLTNGIVWRFFLATEPELKWSERFITEINLENVSHAEDILQNLLSKENVEKGLFIKFARSILYIPKVWTKLLEEPDDLLVELIIEKAKDELDFTPSKQYVEDFLKSQINVQMGVDEGKKERKENLHLQDINIKQDITVYSESGQIVKDKISERRKKRKYKLFKLNFFDIRVEERAISDILVWLLRNLDDRQNGFLEQFSKKVKGRIRNYVSKNIYDLYPDRKDLCEKHHKLIKDGWYLGTNHNTNDFEDMIEKACELANLKCNMKESEEGVLLIYIYGS